MTELATLLVDKEIETYVEKTREPEFEQIQLDELFLNKTAGFDLINQMRKLIDEKSTFFKSIQNREKLTHIEEMGLKNIFEDMKTIIANHYEDKVNIMKTFHSRESYERIMTFLMFLFEKFEIE